MKTAQRSWLTAVVAGGLLLAGCGGGGDETEAALSGLEVPTQEQADAAAEQSITEENADEVFDELSREIEQESDDGDPGAGP